MNKEQKAAVVEELSKELSDSDAVFAIDYRGISVPQAAELREGLRDADTRFRIVKNRLTLLALEKAGTAELKEHMEGPTALAFVNGDAAAAAKTIFKLGSEWELLDYKGGVMDGDALDADSFKAIAKLPGRDQMNAQFAGIVASPLTGLVRGLGSMVQGLASQLQQMADQGLVSGEAPPQEDAEPEPETPKDDAGAEAETPKEETPKEVESPAGADAETASEEDGGGSEDGSSDEAGDGPSGEADPDPEASPEESSEEQAPEGEEAGQGDAEETSEGDADIGEDAPEETSENSDDEKEGGD